MVTHKLHLHDNKMDGSCITTPSEVEGSAQSPFASLSRPTPSMERCGRTYYWILNGGGIYCYCLQGDIEARIEAKLLPDPHHQHRRPPQTQSQLPFNQEVEGGGRRYNWFATFAFNIITFALWLALWNELRNFIVTSWTANLTLFDLEVH